MSRHITLSLILSFLAINLNLFAQHRTVQEAEQIASQFLSKQSKAANRGNQMNAQSSLCLSTTSNELLGQSLSSEPAFFIFTPQEADGYVIVSGVEDATSILGYSYTDHFDANQLPPDMLYLLRKYQEELDACCSLSNQEQRRQIQMADVRKNLPIHANGVNPLISTKWNQDAPYNNLCPMDGNSRSVTGCVATATAQVMKFYEYPVHGHGSISYQTTTNNIQVDYNFESTNFDWANMLNTYTTADYNNEKGTAVATLMAACGAAVQMDYTASASSANLSNQILGTVNYLGYDAETAMAGCDYMTAEQRHTLILGELNNSHPVIFTGQSSDGGHCFILDGYNNDDDTNPSYHVNWGWGGYYDSYFKLDALDPEGQGIGGSTSGFNSDQYFLYGCYPENNTADRAGFWQGETMAVSPSTFKPNTSQSLSITLSNVYNYSVKDFSGKFAFYLKNGDNEQYLGESASFSGVQFLYGYSSFPSSVSLSSGLNAGTYEIIVKLKTTDGSPEQQVFLKNGNPKIVVSDSGEDPDAPSYESNLQTTSFQITSTEGLTVNASVEKICNFGNDSFTGTIKLALADTEGNLITTFGDGSDINGLGHYYQLTYPRTLTGTIPQGTCSDGHYRLYVAANMTGYSGWSYLQRYDFDGTYITGYNHECYLDLYIVNGVIGEPTFTITTEATGPGSVTASASTVNAGESVTFTFTPNEGCSLSQAILNDIDIISNVSDNKYVADNVMDNLQLKATFAVNTYTLTYKVDGAVYKTYQIAYGATITPEAAPEKEGYTFSGWSEIPATMPAHNVEVTGTFAVNNYTLTYKVDGEVYKTLSVAYGSRIIPEAAPTKEGYTFSGWSEIPTTMPAHDVEVTGSFTINSYTLTYYVDGAVYKSQTIEYGAAITPEAAPEKEGYTFSGWSEIPATMPAHNVEVTGTFAVNNYTLTYKVDGEVYKTLSVAYGSRIIPETAPTKEGYTFSGWSEIPTTMPAHDVEVTGSFTINSYTLTYYVDGTVYKTQTIEYGAAITPEAAPEKEGYTFSGWSEIPATMPAHNVEVTGTFAVNNYTLTYKVDGEVYKTLSVAYGSRIIPETAPTKEGYTFSGWSEIPTTMPAHDVEVTGSFTINSYTLTYYVDGTVYKTQTIEYGAAITPEAAPEKEGYTFSGWSEIPTTMPAYDVDVNGYFTINSYTITWKIDGEVFLTEQLEYGQIIVAPTVETREGYDFAWNLEQIPATMPAHDITVEGYYTLGIKDIICDNYRKGLVYDLHGRRVRILQNGSIYIINGKKFLYKE